MRRLLLAAAALCLLMPAAASAKFSAAHICGPSECRTVTFHDGGQTLIRMEEPVVGGIEVSGAGTTTAADRPAPTAPSPSGPWYRVTLCPSSCRADEVQVVQAFPADGYVKVQRGGWIPLDDSALSAYRSAARGIRPYQPVSATEDPPADAAGTPAWAWVAIGVAAAGAVLIAYRRTRRAPARQSG
jgi:hypothetical protein